MKIRYASAKKAKPNRHMEENKKIVKNKIFFLQHLININ